MINNLDKAIKDSGKKSLASVIESIEKELSSIFQSFDVKGLSASDKNRLISALIDESSSDFKSLYGQEFKNFYEKYRDIGLKLDDVRSTFLPIDLIRSVRSTFSDKFEQKNSSASSQTSKSMVLNKISIKQFLKESYENCFFRMLGMPESNSLRKKPFYFVDINQGLVLKSADDKDATLNSILEKRQNIFLREYFPDNDFFDISKSLKIDEIMSNLPSETVDKINTYNETFIEDKFGLVKETADSQNTPDSMSIKELYLKGLKQVLIDDVASKQLTDEDYSIIFEQLYLGAETSPDFLNIPEQFSKHLFLLFPPVQDSSVKSCISEPGKFISMPFMSNPEDIVFGEKIRIPLLEAIIRIRLDQLSGYDDSDVIKLSNKFHDFSFSDVADSYGLIELLITNRLVTSIQVLAEKIDKSVDEYYLNAIKVQKSIISNKKRQETEEGVAPDVAEVEALSKPLTVSEASNANDKSILMEKKSLDLLKNIDDTVGLLLSESASLDIQSNTFRNSSLKDSLFMDILYSLSTVSGNYAEKRLREIKQKEVETLKNKIQPARSEIAIALGIGRGVGLITVLCFSLAMFTVEEQYLLGLLNKKQFENLEKEYPTKNFFNQFKGVRPSIDDSLKEFSLKVMEAYSLFTGTLQSMS